MPGRTAYPLKAVQLARSRIRPAMSAGDSPSVSVQQNEIGLIRSHLLRERPYELDGPLDPRLQLVVVLDAFRIDSDPIPHRLAGDVERPDVRLQQRRFPLVEAEAGDEPVLPDPDECVAVEEEADAAEHLLRFDVSAAGQGVPNSGGEGFIKGH